MFYVLLFLFVLCIILSILSLFFFFNDPATTEIYTYCHTLALPDARPISPRSEAAAEKLRLSATRRKASIPSSAPWGIVKSCFKALADYRGLSIGATVPKKVAQRNERNLSHGLSALLFPPLPLRLRDRCRLGAGFHRPDCLDLAGPGPAEGGRLSLRRPRRSGAHRRRCHADRKAVERQALRRDRQQAVRGRQRTRRRQAVSRRAEDRRRRRSRNRQPDGRPLSHPAPISGLPLSLSPAGTTTGATPTRRRPIYFGADLDRKSTRLNSSHSCASRMP